MGQRLNIEIWNDGRVLANAYYHWSAYTDSAAELTSQILKEIEKGGTADTDLLRAIKLLGCTGAGLNVFEMQAAKDAWGLDGESLPEAVSRNQGLIGITTSGIQETRSWEEGRVSIYLDENRVDFAVLYKEFGWAWEQSQKADYGNKDANYRGLPVAEVNFSDIKFRDFEEVRKKWLNGEYEPIRSGVDPHTVITRIE